MSKGGGSQTSTTKVELPKWLQEAAEKNLAIADEVAAIGYTPYGGPTVAGFTPMQQQAMGNTDQAAAAFGMPSLMSQPGLEGIDPLTGIPMAYMQNGGFSAAPLFEQMRAAIPEPQRKFIESFTMNPQTGAPPANPVVPRPQYNPNAPIGATPTPYPRYPSTPATPYEEWKARQVSGGDTRYNVRSRNYSGDWR